MVPPAAPVKSLELFTANTQACFGAVYEHCLAPVGTAVHRGVQVLSCPHMSTACMHRTAASHAAHRTVQAVTRVAWDGLKTGCSGLSSGLASADGLLTEGLYFTADTIAAWARTSWRLVVKAYTAIESCLGGVCASPEPNRSRNLDPHPDSNPDLGPGPDSPTPSTGVRGARPCAAQLWQLLGALRAAAHGCLLRDAWAGGQRHRQCRRPRGGRGAT